MPGDARAVTESGLKALLQDPVFANTLDQRQLIVRTGGDPLKVFASADPARRAFLMWLLNSTEAMDQYLEAMVPASRSAREQNDYSLPVGALDIWQRIFVADPDARQGLLLRLAIATAIRPPGTGAPGAGQVKPPSDPVVRYQYFKNAQAKKELFTSFDHHTAWEYQFVVSSGASEADLTWARAMINTWRPDLRVQEQVVNSTSEVWRRASPHPYTDYPSILSGGGKCGPRSSWSVMICQAFGIPAIGVGQPAHACVAYQAAHPMVQPQPGSAWKVAYGRGWEVSKLEGLSGPEFLAVVADRSHAVEFSQAEHLRWLASALAAKEHADAVLGVARAIQQSPPDVKTDITASAKAEEAEKELVPEAAPASSSTTNGPVKVTSVPTRIEAAGFSAMAGVRVLACFTGGRQVNFEKNVSSSWVEYMLEVPVAGTYALTLTAATPNDEQVLEVSVGTNRVTTVSVPNTAGLWGATPAVGLPLVQGRQTVRFTAPYQRGIALRHLDLKPGG